MIQKAILAASWLVQQRTAISHAQGACMLMSTVAKAKSTWKSVSCNALDSRMMQEFRGCPTLLLCPCCCSCVVGLRLQTNWSDCTCFCLRREARIDQKMARREAAKEREGSPEMTRLPGGGDVMGGDDSLAAAKAR